MDTEDSALHRYLSMLDENVDNIRRTSSDARDRITLRTLRQLRNSITYERIGSIVVGGSVYESQQSKEVIEDVLIACRESLRFGVMNGGYRGLWNAIIATHYNTVVKQESPEIITQILNCFEAALSAFSEKLLGESDTNWRYANYCCDLVNETSVEFTAENLLLTDFRMPVQSMTSCEEFLKRFSDVVPKILYTTRVFIPNVVNEKE